MNSRYSSEEKLTKNLQFVRISTCQTRAVHTWRLTSELIVSSVRPEIRPRVTSHRQDYDPVTIDLIGYCICLPISLPRAA